MNKQYQQQEASYTLGSWLDEWIVTYKQCSVKEKTFGVYKNIILLIKQFSAADLPLNQIKEPNLQNILNCLKKKKYSKSTITKARYTLRQCFTIALRLHLIDDNPSLYLILPDAPTKKILPLTEDEQIRIEKACYEDNLGHLLIFLLRTGLRRQELMQLTWKDYDAINQEIHVTKSKTPAGIRTVPLLNEAQEIIESQPKINDYIFNSTRATPVTETVMRRLYERLRTETGIKYLTNHVCRHTFVTRLCEKGVSPKAIAQLIGHASTDYVMDIYALIENKKLKLAIYKLDNSQDQDIDNEFMVKLPAALYNKAASCAVTNGLTIESFVANTVLLYLKTPSTKNLYR